MDEDADKLIERALAGVLQETRGVFFALVKKTSPPP